MLGATLLAASTMARAAISLSTTSEWPHDAATYSGVVPFCNTRQAMRGKSAGREVGEGHSLAHSQHMQIGRTRAGTNTPAPLPDKSWTLYARRGRGGFFGAASTPQHNPGLQAAGSRFPSGQRAMIDQYHHLFQPQNCHEHNLAYCTIFR